MSAKKKTVLTTIIFSLLIIYHLYRSIFRLARGLAGNYSPLDFVSHVICLVVLIILIKQTFKYTYEKSMHHYYVIIYTVCMLFGIPYVLFAFGFNIPYIVEALLIDVKILEKMLCVAIFIITMYVIFPKTKIYSNATVPDAELKKYMQLLRDGSITQAEFDTIRKNTSTK